MTTMVDRSRVVLAVIVFAFLGAAGGGDGAAPVAGFQPHQQHRKGAAARIGRGRGHQDRHHLRNCRRPPLQIRPPAAGGGPRCLRHPLSCGRQQASWDADALARTTRLPRPTAPARGRGGIRRRLRSLLPRSATAAAAPTAAGVQLLDETSASRDEQIEELRRSFGAVAELDRVLNNNNSMGQGGGGGGRVDAPDKPTFRRLFDHDAWEMYLGGNNLQIWYECLRHTNISVIVRAIWKSVAFVSLYAFVVSWLITKKFRPTNIIVQQAQQQMMPLSICGSAIGLLLVFRTNNGYGRLEEARQLWGQIVHHSVQIVSRVATVWDPAASSSSTTTTTSSSPAAKNNGEEDGKAGDERPRRMSSEVVTLVCRYVVAHCWALRDKYRSGDERERCDITDLLLPPKQAEFVDRQLLDHRPMAIHGLLRQILYDQANRDNTITDQMHFFLEMDVAALASAASMCERIFTSPIPPTMTRHGLRSLALWFMALPVVMAANNVPPIMTAVWTSIISFIHIGIEELGVQVEQPFQVIPQWQLCLRVQRDIEEIVLQRLQQQQYQHP